MDLISVIRRWRALVLQVALLALVLWVASVGVRTAGDWVRLAQFRQKVKAASPSWTPPGGRKVSWSFPFESKRLSISVRVPAEELRLAAAVDTTRVFETHGKLRDAYVSELVSAQSRSFFVSLLADQLRILKLKYRLDDDEYVEMIASAIQAIPYDEGAGPGPRLPVQFVSEGSGICTEKSALLAALLLHEDFDTAIWVFDSQGHVAVGVGAVGDGFRDSGYAFIETTSPRLVGQADQKYAAAGPVMLPPAVVRVGGTKRYAAWGEVDFILDLLARASDEDHALKQFAFYATSAQAELRQRYSAMKEQHTKSQWVEQYITANPQDREAVYETLAGAGRKAR